MLRCVEGVQCHLWGGSDDHASHRSRVECFEGDAGGAERDHLQEEGGGVIGWGGGELGGG